MNLREAFERCFYEREGHPPSQMNIADIAAWQGFEMGAAHAARECGREARRLMVGPMEREQFATADALANAIRTAFPEAFK